MEAHGFPPANPGGTPSRSLLQNILLRRAFSPHGVPPPGFVRDRVMYGEMANPWQVFLHTDNWWEENAWRVTYIYTKLSGSRRILMRRLAGCGYWQRLDHQDNGQVWHEGVSLGTRTCFRFYPRAGSEHTNRTGLWIMWEYILNPAVTTRWVLCRVGRNNAFTLIGHPVPPPPPLTPPQPPEEIGHHDSN